MKKTRHRYYDDFPRTTRIPKKNEIWLAYFPYYQRGGIEKLRPVLIHNVKDDEAMVQMITSNPKSGKEIKLKRGHKSYLKNNFARVKLYKCYRKLQNYEKN